ncbi:MAG: hypothetical protein N838_03070 [Thiohalocapsa sp. PB-PSB1]|jgi:cell division protein FtsW (lipid II flippase)|nr:MAG: hypothetical protein N838_03070 [Thiohalocapsa sp. PB-PSB1]
MQAAVLLPVLGAAILGGLVFAVLVFLHGLGLSYLSGALLLAVLAAVVVLISNFVRFF